MSEYRRNWDRDVVEEYIKPESQQKSPAVFRETHVEIDKIGAEILRPHRGGDDFVTEEQVRDAVLASELMDDNRIFIVKGEVGSGKSHLCQWLEYEINGYDDGERFDDTHVAIHISRSNTRLDEILEILHEPVDKEYEEVSDISSLDPVDVADFIIKGLQAFYRDKNTLRGFDLDAFLDEYGSSDTFRRILIDNIEEYQDSVEREDQEQNIKEFLLSREDYGKICFTAFGETRHADTVYPFIRRAVHDLLTRNIGIEDFKGELETISEAYVEAGKRPVLICEDLTTFSVLKDDLLDHIFELSSGHYDVILGWTTGWERENIDDALSKSEDSLTYMKQRCEGYLNMTDETGQAYFLEGRSAPVVLVKQYLDAIKRRSEMSVDIPEEAFDDLYPFNAAFIRHVYANLVQDGNLQQTPRILLVHVVADCLTSDVPPFQAIQHNAYVKDRPYLIEIHGRSQECLNLTAWYAYRHDDRLWLPAALFNVFGVESTGGSVEEEFVFFEPSYGAGNVEVVDREPGGEIVVVPPTLSESDGQTSGPGEDRPDSGSTTTDDPPTVGPATTTTDQPVPPEDYREFQNWLLNGGEYESVDRFRDGLVATLERWHDSTRLANEIAETVGTTGIYYARGSDPPVFVKGADVRTAMSFEVEHGSEHERLYREMLRYGYVETYDDEANFDELRSWADDKVVKFRRRMRSDIEAILPGEMTIEEFIVVSWFLLMNAGQGATSVTKELMFESYHLQDSSPLGRQTALELDLPRGLDSSFTEITKHSKELNGLVNGFFLLKKNIVDHDRLTEAIRRVSDDLEAYLSNLATVSVEDLADAYRLGTTRSTANKQLATVIRDVSEYAGELEKLEQQVDLGPLRDEVERYRELNEVSHDRQQLTEIVSALTDSLAPLDIAKRERWSQVEDLLEDSETDLQLEAFRETLTDLSDGVAEDPIEIMAALHEYEASHRSQAAWKVYNVIDEMIEALEEGEGADAKEFRDAVRDSEEVEAFTKQRDAVITTVEGMV